MGKPIYKKPCEICGTEVPGIRRKDRKSFHYPKRCSKCKRKVFDASKKANKVRVLNQVRVTHPIGSTRLHNSRGYIYRKIKVDNTKVWRYEHRVVAEKKIGRKLLPKEVVHHINEDTLDNRPENLAVILAGDHARLHHSILSWSKKHDACVDCGRTDRSHVGHGYCTACYQRYKARQIGHWPKRNAAN